MPLFLIGSSSFLQMTRTTIKSRMGSTFCQIRPPTVELAALIRVPTRQGKVREIWFFFKVREKSGNSVKWSGKLENLQKSGKSQGI